MNSYVNKITKSINNFNLNVVVANVYEIYNLFSDHLSKDVSDKCLKNNFTNVMKMLIPFTPHIANECLELLGVEGIKVGQNRYEINSKEKIKIAIQINGKTRDVIDVDKGINQKTVEEICKNNDKIKSKIVGKPIKKIIFVKDRIINLLLNHEKNKSFISNLLFNNNVIY